jgi:hypothetical protein
MAKIQAPFQVEKMSFDAARPYAVVATFRSFNRVIGRYATLEQAKRRARDKNNEAVDRYAAAVGRCMRLQREA